MNTSTNAENVFYEDIPQGTLDEDDFFCTEKIVPRKIKPQNIVMRLMDREIYGSRKPGSHFHVVREFYQNVFPNLTIVNVEKPPCFLRKFSPDGKHFIAFSSDQTSLEIYEYRGASAAGDLVAGYPSDLLNADADAHHRIRTHIFYRFFKPKFTVNVCQQRLVSRVDRNSGQLPFMEQQLNRECSLFTEDGRYVIVGSAAHIPDDLRPHFYHIHSNNEAVTPTIRSALEDYSLHLVDLHHGKLCDTKHFRTDKIYLSHNQGIYLYKEVLAVLSVQHQTIHLFQIVEGMLIEIRKIGRFCYDDDPFIVSSVFAPMMNERPFYEETINSLKHRLLVFLFKRAKSISDETKDPLELRKFYKYFEMFKSLRMWKMQLLDEDHLFIKYASEEVVTLRVAEPNSQSSFFVIYNISESKILEVYENTSEGLLQLFENYCDCFRNARLCADSQFTCSPSNNLYARLTQQRFKQTIVRAIYGGRTEATKRILAQLPISAQSYSGSPYLDLGLFSYDDKWVSVMERPKAYGEYPIRYKDFHFIPSYYNILKYSVFKPDKVIPSYTQVIGEGEVNSVFIPDGSMQMYFIPTIRYDHWAPYLNTPNINNFNNSKNSECWFVRSVTLPISTRFNNQLPNLYGDLLSTQLVKPDCRANLPFCPEYHQKFHNDSTTSTTDISYFYPSLRQEKALQNSALLQTNIPYPANYNITYDGVNNRPCNCKVSFRVEEKEISGVCTCHKSASLMSVDSIKNKSSQESINKKNYQRSKHKNQSHRRKHRDHICKCNVGVKGTSDKLVTTYKDRASGNDQSASRDTQTLLKSKRTDVKTEKWAPIEKKNRRKSSSSINTPKQCASCSNSNDCACASTTDTESQ